MGRRSGSIAGLETKRTGTVDGPVEIAVGDGLIERLVHLREVGAVDPEVNRAELPREFGESSFIRDRPRRAEHRWLIRRRDKREAAPEAPRMPIEEELLMGGPREPKRADISLPAE